MILPDVYKRQGVDTTVYARGRRLADLRQNGLRYEKGGRIQTADVRVLDVLMKDDIYDFIFLTVRENQLHEALVQLWENQSPYIVTMVNSLEDYSQWEALCGTGRIKMCIRDSVYTKDCLCPCRKESCDDNLAAHNMAEPFTPEREILS